MTLLKEIFSHPILIEKPCVLIDVGASGEIHRKWKGIAKYCVCLAFDADDRKMNYTEQESKNFRRLITINRIVTELSREETDFYLTRSPYCSSALQPDLSALEPWLFRDKFEIVKKISLKAITLSKALEDLNISYIDWFKTDTQGTDLRLYKSLPDSIRGNILFAEFEPGLIDSYKGEDKLHQILSYFDTLPYWLAELIIKGSQRLPSTHYSALGRVETLSIAENLVKAPGWGEMLYCRDFGKSPATELRECLLAYAFAYTQRQYGYCLEIVNEAEHISQDPILNRMKSVCLKKIKFKQANFFAAGAIIAKRRFSKILSGKTI